MSRRSHKYTHGNVIQFNMRGGTGTATLSYISLPTSGAISFEYKSQCHEDNTLTVIIDGTTHNIDGIGAGYRWRKTTLPLSAGEHTIVFSGNKNTNSYYPSYTNAIYIDNVSIASDTIDSVEITPRGTQQTYIGGHTIQYSANVLRSDKSVIAGKSVSWSVSGGGNITSDGLFTPTTAGTFTVTAAIGDKTSTSTIVVHQSNTSDSITIGETTFTGVDNSSITGSALANTNIATFDTTKMPDKTTFNADGYFPIAGTVTPDGDWNALYVTVTKEPYSTQYILQGTFNQRIWLRFGPGEYTVSVADAKCNFYTDINGNQGAMNGWSYQGKFVMLVTNTNTMSADDAMFLLPSHYVNHDDYRIQNVASDIVSQLPSGAVTSDKLRALHDWITDNFYYDYSSYSTYNNGNSRRHQESIYALQNGCGVCEGYANLFTAFARYIGVRTRYVSNDVMNHAWTEVWYDNGWHLTDVTWDDPTVEPCDYTNTAPLPYREYYTYFIRDDQYKHDEEGTTTYDSGRGEPTPPKILGEVLDGWF